MREKTTRECTLRGISFNRNHISEDAPYTYESQTSIYKTMVWGFDGNDKRDFDLAIVLGLSYEIKRLVIDARYALGTIPVYKEEVFNSEIGNCELRNGHLILTLGYRFE